MKKKLVITLIIIFIVVLFFISYIFITNKELNNDYSNDFSSNNQEVNFPINIYNFSINIENQNSLHASFNILNNNESITNKTIYLNFYNDKKLLHTYEYEIIELVSGDSILVDANIDFEFDKITRYEFVYDKIKKDMKPYM